MAERSLMFRQKPSLPVPMKDIIRGRELFLDNIKIAQLSNKLFWAIKYDDYGRAEALLKAGADPNVRDKHGAPPLARALHKPLPELCSLLVRYGADVNIDIEGGITPLMSASMGQGRTLTVKCLIGCGADKDAMSDAGKTPLMFALQNACVDNVRALLEAGADPNAHDEYMHHPLIWAINHSRTEVSMPMVAMLVNHGADCSYENIGTSVFSALRRAYGSGWKYNSATISFLNAFLKKKEVRNILNEDIMKPFMEEFLDCISSPIGSYLN